MSSGGCHRHLVPEAVMLLCRTGLRWARRATSTAASADVKPFEAIPSPKRMPLIGHLYLLKGKYNLDGGFIVVRLGW